MTTRVTITKDIRFNNGIKTAAIRVVDEGYEVGYWCDGVFHSEGIVKGLENAMRKVGMVQAAVEDRRPAWSK